MSISPHCRELLSQSMSYHPHYGNRLANHLPMVLVALDQLGSNPTKLTEFYNTYHCKLETIESNLTSNPMEPTQEHLGNPDNFQNYFLHFQNAIQDQGINQILKSMIPMLIPGLAASAFHAMIRLAYAIESRNETDIALSLAYWAAEYQPFHTNMQTDDRPLEEILKRVSPLTINHSFPPGIIVDRMNEAAYLLNQKNTILQTQKIGLIDIAKFSIQAFAEENNFTLLHTVTASHAFRIITPYINDLNTAIRYLWEAIVVAYLSTGLNYKMTTPKTITHPINDQWDNIKKLACNSNDDHTIKLVYSCWQEYLEYDNSIYYLVANQAVQNKL